MMPIRKARQVAAELVLALVEEPMMPIRKARQVAAELISVLRTMLLAEMTVEAEPAMALVAEPMMPIRKTRQVTTVNPTEVLVARPQRMTPIPHRHLPEK